MTEQGRLTGAADDPVAGNGVVGGTASSGIAAAGDTRLASDAQTPTEARAVNAVGHESSAAVFEAHRNEGEPAVTTSAAATTEDASGDATSGPSASSHASVVDLNPDSDTWDAFVAGSNPGSYLQTSAWAIVKAANGWTSLRFIGSGVPEPERQPSHPAEPAAADALPADDQPGARHDPPAPSERPAAFGAQLLLRRPRMFPWAFAYSPRGPLSESWDEATVEAFTEALRHALASAPTRVSHVRIEPEIELDGPHDRDGSLRHALRRAGWRPGSAIQPPRTRMIDLTQSEEQLWSDLRKKWRQYVNKARRSGIRVVDADEDRLPEFYEIYQETAKRAGFIIRTFESYVGVWRAFARLGMARLLFAEDSDGTGIATLFVLQVGNRVIEPYGGMTAAGAESRANYLLKWEAIRTSRERGAVSYDMWGLSHEGIEHFKTGFGGREIRYVGAWDLVLDPAGRLAFDTAQQMQDRVGRWRHGIRGSRRAGDQPADAGE